MKKLAKILVTLLLLFLYANCFAFSTNPYDYAGSYSLFLITFQSQPVHSYKYTLDLEANGLYMLLEHQIIGEHTYEYPLLTGVWYIDPDSETIVLDVTGTPLPFYYDDGILIADSSVYNLHIMMYNKTKLCYYSKVCKYDIVGDDTASVGDEKTYYVTSNSDACRYNIDVDDNATVTNIHYTLTGDAIVTIQFNNEGITNLTVANTIFSINVESEEK